MKKQLLSGLAIAAFTGLSAQITITSNDIAALYTVVLQANDTLPTVTAGPAGTNQNWDYSALANHRVDSLEYTLPQFTPYGSFFPSANRAIITAPGSNPFYSYFDLNSSIFQVTGAAFDVIGTGVVPINFSNPETQITFPSTYNTSFVDTSMGMFQMYYGQDPGIGFTVDSFRIHIWVKKTSNIDGWGTVTTPSMTNVNCIRQNALRVEYDTIDIYAFGNWAPAFFNQQDSNRVYTHWANGVGFPVCEITDAQDLGTITSGNYLLSSSVIGVNEHQNSNASTAFPVPANDILYIRFTGDVAGLNVYDINGRLVQRTGVNGLDGTSINVRELPNGIYFYELMDTNGASMGKTRFSVAH
jgi:hypothetical protein